MLRRMLIIHLLLLFVKTGYAQFNFDSLMASHPAMQRVARNPEKYHLQIVYTQVDRQGEVLSLKTFSYHTGVQNYLYCASLVKLPTAILALQKLNELHIDPGTTMWTDSSRACHQTVQKDTSALNGLPSVANYIKRMCLVSDNASFSRLYEFLGTDYIHEQLYRMGFPNVRIVNRYDGNCQGNDHFICNPIRFLDDTLRTLYRQEEQIAKRVYTPVLKNIRIGKAYKQGQRMLRQPKDFTYSNYLNLTDCHHMLSELVFARERLYGITEPQRAWLIQQLSLYPRQSYSPRYDQRTYVDAYKKYLFFGAAKEPITDTNLIVTNIVGQSYGFMSDCAYFRDKTTGVEFLLSAGLYANEDDIIDGKYDYKTVALPFLAALGQAVFAYEKKRKIN